MIVLDFTAISYQSIAILQNQINTKRDYGVYVN